MARTKKDKTEIPAEEQLTGEPVAEGGVPQTDPTPDATPSLPDLELGAAGSLDPDAPQTGAEQEAAEGGPPHTDLENGEIPSDLPGGPAEDPDALHTDLEDGGEGFAPGDIPSEPHTDLESVTQPEDGQVRPGDPDSQPGAPHTDLDPAPEVEMTESPSEGTPEEEASIGQSNKKLKMPRRRGPRVVSIDAERTVETDVDKLRSDLLDLVESLKGKKILTGTIQGVERLADNPELSYAVTYHGDYKIIIPVLEAVEEPEDYRGQPKGDVLHYLLNKRLGAEVDYIVKGIDQENGIIAASRLEAMALKRREYYFRTDRDGNYQIYAGIRAEARVVSVIRAGIFVDLFGAECYIPLRELSYQRWVDATAHYQPGQRVLVQVLEVDRSDRNRLRVAASVKQASENPYEKALKKYAVGSRYVGTVSMVDTTGVFVSLDGGIDCLCTYPKRGRPPRGCRVTVRILGINHESNRIWGVITHMSTAR